MTTLEVAPPTEASNLTFTQRCCLIALLARLDPDHPGFHGTDQVRYLLTKSEIPTPGCTFSVGEVHPLLRSWILPMLRLALYGPGAPDAAVPDHVAQDAGRVRASVLAAGGESPASRESKNLRTFQRDALVTVLAWLDPTHPGCAICDGAKYLMKAISLPTPGCAFPTGSLGPYLQSWVLPLICLALYGPHHPGAALPGHALEDAGRALAAERAALSSTQDLHA